MNVSFFRVLGFVWLATALVAAFWFENSAMTAIALCGAAFAEIGWLKDRLGI